MHNLVKQATGLDFTEYENDVVAAKVAASSVLGFDLDLEGEDINQTCSSVGHVLNEVYNLPLHYIYLHGLLFLKDHVLSGNDQYHRPLHRYGYF